ncbi:hypothetical protein Leryth_012891 [Lithospermum erythrorhizon]|nr:hypothetical protein Leryth_012891 [Lithospermum erythrorhizon]
MASRKRSLTKHEDMHSLYKEWDEVKCSICMEHPHNAVMLLCSSHDKGCCSFICDTSYRHSNCLDRFKGLKTENLESPPLVSLSSGNQHVGSSSSGVSYSTGLIGNHEQLDVGSSRTTVNMGQHVDTGNGGHVAVEGHEIDNLSETRSNMKCPLCRGNVLGWNILEEARTYLNLKRRSCSHELCPFIGNYRELRRHARMVHPTARPADVDPTRQRAWRRLEHQQEHDDIVTAVRSAMPGAIVIGDYVVENGDRVLGERERGGSGDNGRLLSTFFLFQMIGSADRGADLRGGRSRASSRYRRSSGTYSRRRFLWGENLLGLQNEDNDDEGDEQDLSLLSDLGDDDASLNPRRRRRLTRFRSEDQP